MGAVAAPLGSDEAITHACEAALLVVFSGDITLVHSVLFNIANILSMVRRQDPGAVRDGLAINLVETDRTIRHRFGLGKDSAQGKLLLALLAWEKSDWDRADACMAEAKAIKHISRIPADEAPATRITCLIQIARGERRGLQTLGKAIALFEAIGDMASADYVRAE